MILRMILSQVFKMEMNLLKQDNLQNKYNKIKCKNMQNQLQYQSSFQSNSTRTIGSPVFGSPNNPRGFDKTLPTNNIKHYASNPNLSMEVNYSRHLNHISPDPNTYNNPTINKNIDFRNPPSNNNYPYNSNPTSNNRSQRGNQMTRSLIIGENQRVETPEEGFSPKRQMYKNMPKRPYRMSETIQDLPQTFISSKKEQTNNQLSKQSNFYKNKQLEREEKVEQKIKQPFRPAPSFLSRGNDMKRSLVIEPTFQNRYSQLQQQLKQIPKPQKKRVSVDDFVKLKELGSGKYGRVYLVRQKYCGFICALKVIQKKLLHEQQITDQFIRQVKIQMFLNHPNIIKMYDCFDDSINLYIILQVGTGGQLYHQLKKSQPLSQPRIAFIMKQVCDAVNEIHGLRIIHRDIKPQNIVLHDNIIKLCDFGWSVHQDNKLRTTFCGTPLYVCPQILKGREYDQKIDIWSIGIMMYEMVVGQNPFKITRQQELIKIVKDQIKIPSYLFVSAEVRDFLDRCLQKNPNDRANIRELLNHPFFKKHQQKTEKSKLINI